MEINRSNRYYWVKRFEQAGIVASQADKFIAFWQVRGARYPERCFQNWVARTDAAFYISNQISDKHSIPDKTTVNLLKPSSADPKPLVPWYMDLPPKREEPTISPEEQAEIDEIRNRIMAKFH